MFVGLLVVEVVELTGCAVQDQVKVSTKENKHATRKPERFPLCSQPRLLYDVLDLNISSLRCTHQLTLIHIKLNSHKISDK